VEALVLVMLKDIDATGARLIGPRWRWSNSKARRSEKIQDAGGRGRLLS